MLTNQGSESQLRAAHAWLAKFVRRVTDCARVSFVAASPSLAFTSMARYLLWSSDILIMTATF